MSQNIEITAMPAAPDVGSLPEELVEYFAAKNQVIHLSNANATNQAMERGYGRNVVMFSELPEDIQRVVRSSGFDPPERHFGELRRGDTILVAQTYENRDKWRGMAEFRRRVMEDDVDTAVQQLDDRMHEVARAKGGKPGAIRIGETTVGPASSHVTGGPALAELIAKEQELAERARGPRTR